MFFTAKQLQKNYFKIFLRLITHNININNEISKILNLLNEASDLDLWPENGAFSMINQMWIIM